MFKLFESYNTHKELEKLVNGIFDVFVDVIMLQIKKYNKLHFIDNIKLGEVKKIHEYKELRKFIGSFYDMLICICTNDDIDGITVSGKASYVTSGDKHYIFIMVKEHTIDNINDYVSRYSNDERQLRASIHYRLDKDYGDSLIHELQHAFDEFRSGGKATIQQDNITYSKEKKTATELNKKKLEELSDSELMIIGDFHRKYLNLKHEVDARLASAIKAVNFYEYDIDNSIELNKDVYTILPFEKVFRDFKYKMHGYKWLNDKHKKRVQKKLGQFYELEKEFIKKKNEEAKPYNNTK